MSTTNPRQTFLNPTIPFTGTILGGLLPGEMVLIQGSVLSDANRFQVDFTCGSSVKPRADVAFHFNPRFHRTLCIVCNTLQNQRWGQEEILYQNPFSAGATFEIIILVLRDQFKVAVNGVHLLQYNHRVALQRVDTLCISGDIDMSAIGILPNSSSPEASRTNQEAETNPISYPTPLLCLPFRGQLIGGLSVGRSITITGQTNQNADRFCVNLRVSGCNDIALHLNPRLKKRVFVRNSFLLQRWGPEETAAATFPFSPGRYFEIIILCELYHFRVAVDGLHQLDYKHRVQDLKRITEIEVLGDIQLLDIKTV